MEKLKLIKCWKTLLLLICMSMFSGTIFAQGITLRGKVVDNHGEPLIGAKVAVTASPATAASTNISGDFVLRVPAGTTSITITYIGYITVTQTVKPNSGDFGEIPMAQDANNLNEVVVVGYGTQNKRDVTGSTTSIDNASLQEVPSAGVINQLEGKVAGLDVINGSIRIRGNRTIGQSPQSGADGPLIVVDGVPYNGSINDVNPQDIKNVEILKDASATAIYGSRGSGGVLLITTNRGRVGRSITTLNNFYGISNIINELHVLNGQQYAQLKLDAVATQPLQGNGTSQTYTLSPAEQTGLANGVNTDWQKLLYVPAYTADQTLGINGGTESTQFNISAGYRVNTGIEPNQRAETYRLQNQIDHKVSKSITIGVNMTNTLSYNNSGGGGQQTGAINISPLLSPFNPDGTFNAVPWVGLTDSNTPSPLEPKYNGSAYYNNTRSFHDVTNIYAEWTIMKDLKYKFTMGYDFSQSLNQAYNGINSTSVANQLQTNANLSNTSSYHYVLDNLLTYDHTFAQKHHVTFVALFSSEKTHNDNSNMSATNLPSDAVQATNLSLGTFQGFGGSYSEQGLVSEMARLNYSFDGRLALTATVRNDANSTLAAGHQYLAYPAIGAAWNVSNEKWMQQYSWIDNLKLRAGYGVTSNGPLNGGPYQTLGALSKNGASGLLDYEYGGTAGGNQQGLLVSSLANVNLTWQKTAEYNLAIDFGLLKDRLTGTIEVYTDKTTGILLSNVLPASTGATNQTSNLGTSANKGLEITLNSINIQNKGGFSWTTDFNIAFSREHIVALPNGTPANIGAGEFVGWPLNVVYDAQKIGIWQLADQTNGALAAQTSPKQFPGQIRVADLNGDGVINQLDNKILGTYQPQYTGGITNRFTYKGIDLSIVIAARMGMITTIPYLSTGGSAGGYAFLLTGRHNQPYINYWTPTNPTNDFPGANSSVQSFNYASTLQYYDGSWIKARSINLGYQIPSRYLSRVGISSLRVYLNCTNPFVIYAPSDKINDGMDPEGTGGAASVGSTTSGSNPRAQGLNISEGWQRVWQLGINLKF